MNARWETIDRVFHAALDRPAAERAAFVRRELSDTELAEEVLSLLESGGDENVPRQPLHLHGLMDALGSAFLSGTKIGPYVVGDLLGEGGMGLVYRAVDERDGATVAIKVLAPEQARHPGRVERFLREAKAMAAISHPAVVRIREAGSAAGLHYLAMEYLDGETLQQRIRRAGALPLDELLACGEAVAGALQAAHSSGVTHRDLKPENVMLTADGVKVLDFGVAHLDDQEDAQRTTLESALKGTISYLAPEQIEGAPATTQSDLFSLGVLLWEAAAGQPLFQRANPIATARAILEDRPDYRPVPAALRPVLQKCLARDPRRRFHSAGEVLAALRAARQKPPIRLSKTAVAAMVAVLAGGAWGARMYFGASAGISRTVVVPAATDIWLAGQPDGTALTGNFGTDTAPAESPVRVNVSAGHTLTFSAGGSTSVNGSCWVQDADGGCYPDESIFGSGPSHGLSSIAGPASALIGVFLGNEIPHDRVPPNPLNFTGSLKSRDRFAPELRQVFFIGDGRTGTGSGAVQRFRVPAGATRLFLAVADSLGGSVGNLGQLTVKITDLDGKPGDL